MTDQEKAARIAAMRARRAARGMADPLNLLRVIGAENAARGGAIAAQESGED